MNFQNLCNEIFSTSNFFFLHLEVHSSHFLRAIHSTEALNIEKKIMESFEKKIWIYEWVKEDY